MGRWRTGADEAAGAVLVVLGDVSGGVGGAGEGRAGDWGMSDRPKLHEWERIKVSRPGDGVDSGSYHWRIQRLRVEGGWLYMLGDSPTDAPVYIPDPAPEAGEVERLREELKLEQLRTANWKERALAAERACAAKEDHHRGWPDCPRCLHNAKQDMAGAVENERLTVQLTTTEKARDEAAELARFWKSQAISEQARERETERLRREWQQRSDKFRSRGDVLAEAVEAAKAQTRLAEPISQPVVGMALYRLFRALDTYRQTS